MAKGDALKDQLYNADKLSYLAGLFRRVDPSFDPTFEARCLARFPELELKQRIDWIARCLIPALPADFPQAAQVIEAALPPPLDPTLRDDDFGDFIFAPLGEYAVLQGLEDHPERLLDLLEALTQRFSMEYAIRPVINRWPDLAFDRLMLWTGHDSYHVRRLVSEGTRPRLPWGIGLTSAPARPLPLLDRLYGDRARFVTRSVANHLNDIGKKTPEAVIDRLTAWNAAGNGAELDWITRHALRDLVKKGHPDAMALLGFPMDAPVSVDLTLPESARIGAALEFTLHLSSPQGLSALVDYVVTFPPATPGAKARRKVHKLTTADLTPDTPLQLTKRHKLPADATTYRLHPGPARVEIQVNGQIRASGDLVLTT